MGVVTPHARGEQGLPTAIAYWRLLRLGSNSRTMGQQLYGGGCHAV